MIGSAKIPAVPSASHILPGLPDLHCRSLPVVGVASSTHSPKKFHRSLLEPHSNYFPGQSPTDQRVALPIVLFVNDAQSVQSFADESVEAGFQELFVLLEVFPSVIIR